MKNRALEHEGQIYVHMEDYINTLIDRVTAYGMELEVYLDDYTPEQYQENRNFIRGFTAATHMFATDYASLTTDPQRAMFVTALCMQMDKIMEAK
jgi:hypothetical protein